MEVSLHWVSRFQVGSATPALSQEAKNDDPGPSYYIPALADAGPVQRRTDVAVITKAVRAIRMTSLVYWVHVMAGPWPS